MPFRGLARTWWATPTATKSGSRLEEMCQTLDLNTHLPKPPPKEEVKEEEAKKEAEAPPRTRRPPPNPLLVEGGRGQGEGRGQQEG